MRRALVTLIAAASFGFFLWDAGSRGWSQSTTDFPNYYTAAVLAREHRPLHSFYDWVWFQRQMNFAGIENQLGGYIPQTPLTMAPFVPLSYYSPQTARKVWFILNLALLGLTLFLISRLTRFSVAELWLLAFLGYYAFRANFELGQYYVFLLALLTLAIYCVRRKRDAMAGVLLGLAVALKLYAAPFLPLMMIGRRGRFTLALSAAVVLSVLFAIALFGWSDVSYFATSVLPRALLGETLNPYHASNGTAATLLRRIFIAEGELNPRPWFDSPFVFHLLLTLFTFSVILLPALAAARQSGSPSRRTLAWWLVGMLLVSPNTASYTFVLLLLPVALLVDELPRRASICILLAYFLLTLPLRAAWSWSFPKVWLLVALFFFAGYPEMKLLSPKLAIPLLVAVVGLSALSATLQREDHFDPAVLESGAIYSASPATSSGGLVYESIGSSKYVLRKSNRTFSFDGEAFHPAVPDSGGPIYFELVARGHSTIVRFDERTRHSETVPIEAADPREPAVSHNGKMLAAISNGALYVFGGHTTRRLVSAARDPAFVAGDRGIVFVTDAPIASIRLLDLQSGSVTTLLDASHDLDSPSLSPDRTRLLFAARRKATWQVWVKDLVTHNEKQLTYGNCNSYDPVWNGLREIVFASDCRRGLGLPGLFHAALQ
ncbi:MAG: glycosyltransferase 87 family protein [Acidobacteriota bacterium]|nr:glycosyltransferase 87 family protein [Acidobacteriota bacterium]